MFEIEANATSPPPSQFLSQQIWFRYYLCSQRRFSFILVFFKLQRRRSWLQCSWTCSSILVYTVRTVYSTLYYSIHKCQCTVRTVHKHTSPTSCQTAKQSSAVVVTYTNCTVSWRHGTRDCFMFSKYCTV